MNIENKNKMINWKLYDEVKIKNINWIDKKYKRFYSRSIPYKPFYTILKKYNQNNNCTDYYLATIDEPVSGYNWHGAQQKKDFIKYDLSFCWDDVLKSLPMSKQVIEVNVELVEEDDVAAIYYIDI